MPRQTLVKKSVYYDSVKLMLVSRELKALPGVNEVAVVMGTELNKEVLANTELMTPEAEAATANDMIIAILADSEEQLAAALSSVDALLGAAAATAGGEEYRPKSIERAVAMQPGSNLCTISVPGQYAADLAMEALTNGLHVLLFSDNVSLEDEHRLKTYAAEKGLFVMGPDCGTAMVGGVPLCFANKVRRGDIGLVAASGTGAQEVMTLVHKNGGGLSQVIGTGGRDLKEEIGGITFLQGLRALNEDEGTKVIALVSKPPAPSVTEKIISCIRSEVKKPVVAHFLGGSPVENCPANLHFVSSLEEVALLATSFAGVGGTADSPKADIPALAREEAQRLPAEAKYLRGIFSGGTLAGEAVLAIESLVSGPVDSNTKGVLDCFQMQGHAVVDLGDDAYTVGRPHPMIDPSLRAEVLRHELANGETAVILFDIVLGYGANPEPEKELVAEIAAWRAKGGGNTALVASVCGCEDDPQDYCGVIKALSDAGVLVMPSNYQAAKLAAQIILEHEKGVE